jgi:ubiquinone/menaquinone biosynthesis C-methylase UbiE
MVRTLTEIKRVLKTNGKLIIIQPNFKYCAREYFDDYTHLQIFTHIGVTDLLIGLGFSIVDVKPRFLPFSMKSNLPKYTWLVRLYLLSPFKPFAGQMLVVAKR